MPTKPRNSPNPPGRPPRAREAVAKLVPAVQRGEITVGEAAEKAGVSQRTAYVAVKAAEAAREAPPPPSKTSGPLAVHVDQAEAVRRLVAAGQDDGDLVGRLAATFGCGPGEVRALLAAAAVQVELDALPAELAREESIALARRVRGKAEESADWKTALAAQQHMDRLRGLAQQGGAVKPAGGYTRAEVVALLRRVAARSPEAAAAVREVIASGG